MRRCKSGLVVEVLEQFAEAQQLGKRLWLEGLSIHRYDYVVSRDIHIVNEPCHTTRGLGVLKLRGEHKRIRTITQSNLAKARLVCPLLTRDQARDMGRLGHVARALNPTSTKSPEFRAQRVTKEMRRYKKRKAAGLCVRCEQPSPDYNECAACRTVRAARRRARRASTT